MIGINILWFWLIISIITFIIIELIDRKGINRSISLKDYFIKIMLSLAWPWTLIVVLIICFQSYNVTEEK